jgi:hypothetical protein
VTVVSPVSVSASAQEKGQHVRSARRRVLRTLVALAVAAPVALAGSAAYAATVSCRVTWGSTAKQAGINSVAPLVAVAAGGHACYDRLVFTLDGPAGGYRVRYVPQVLTEGQGLPVSLRGGAFLQVSLLDPAYNTSGVATYTPPVAAEAVNVSGFRTLRQVAFAGTFEGYTSFGVGVRARLPFRAFVLAGPGSRSRVVVDVASHW